MSDAASTPASSAPQISVSLLSAAPTTAALQSAFAFGTALFTYLSTPAGQKQVDEMMAAGAKFEAAVESVATKFATGLHNFFSKL